MDIIIIAAVAENGVIGSQRDLPWRLPNDLKHFKNLTTGHTVIMGRKTLESFPRGPLPNRRNIVISRNESLEIEGAEVYTSPEIALQAVKNVERVFIIGGAQVYKLFMDKATHMELTHIHGNYDGEVVFPDFDQSKWEETAREKHEADERHEVSYSFASYRRK